MGFEQPRFRDDESSNVIEGPWPTGESEPSGGTEGESTRQSAVERPNNVIEGPWGKPEAEPNEETRERLPGDPDAQGVERTAEIEGAKEKLNKFIKDREEAEGVPGSREPETGGTEHQSVVETRTTFERCKACGGSGRRFIFLRCKACGGMGNVSVKTSQREEHYTSTR